MQDMMTAMDEINASGQNIPNRRMSMDRDNQAVNGPAASPERNDMPMPPAAKEVAPEPFIALDDSEFGKY